MELHYCVRKRPKMSDRTPQPPWASATSNMGCSARQHAFTRWASMCSCSSCRSAAGPAGGAAHARACAMAPTACSTSAAFFWTCCTSTSNSPTACARATGWSQLPCDCSLTSGNRWREEIQIVKFGVALPPMHLLVEKLAGGSSYQVLCNHGACGASPWRKGMRMMQTLLMVATKSRMPRECQFWIVTAGSRVARSAAMRVASSPRSTALSLPVTWAVQSY